MLDRTGYSDISLQPDSKLLDVTLVDYYKIEQGIIKNVRGTTCEFPWTLN